MIQKLISRLPPRLQAFAQLLQIATNRHISAHAAGICFFMLLALFPAAILSCSILRVTGLSHTDLLNAIRLFLPAALLPLAAQLLQAFFAVRSIGTLSATALLAIWSASRGIYGIMLGLNAICSLQEKRTYLRRRLICAGYLLVVILLLPVSLVAHMIGNALLLSTGLLFALLQHLASVLILSLIFSTIYRAFPDARLRFRACLIGGIFAALGWQLFSALFSLYAHSANSYSIFYGSLQYCALGLLWLYFCMMILLFGGLLAGRIHLRLSRPHLDS